MPFGASWQSDAFADWSAVSLLITAASVNADEDRILFIAFTYATGAKTSVTMRPLLVALPKSDLPSTHKQLR